MTAPTACPIHCVGEFGVMVSTLCGQVGRQAGGVVGLAGEGVEGCYEEGDEGAWEGRHVSADSGRSFKVAKNTIRVGALAG